LRLESDDEYLTSSSSESEDDSAGEDAIDSGEVRYNLKKFRQFKIESFNSFINKFERSIAKLRDKDVGSLTIVLDGMDHLIDCPDGENWHRGRFRSLTVPPRPLECPWLPAPEHWEDCACVGHRMSLPLLECLVGIEVGVGVIQADNKTEMDQIRLHMIEEGTPISGEILHGPTN
jgi:hypothetical protein